MRTDDSLVVQKLMNKTAFDDFIWQPFNLLSEVDKEEFIYKDYQHFDISRSFFLKIESGTFYFCTFTVSDFPKQAIAKEFVLLYYLEGQYKKLETEESDLIALYQLIKNQRFNSSIQDSLNDFLNN